MKLLLVSDSGMNVNKGGFQQTLYNIFSFLAPEDFLLITSAQANKIAWPSPPFSSRVITYNLQPVPLQQNRLGRYVNSFINRLNFIINNIFSRRFKPLQAAIIKFNPDVVVVAPNGTDGIIIYGLLKEAFKNKKVFPYFMDDWLYQLKRNSFGKNIYTTTKQLLAKNNCWLMISKNLADIFSARYKIYDAKTLSIHNPVDMSNVAKTLPTTYKEEFTIAYAGALWQMHFDALIVMAKAIRILQKVRKLKLIIYTDKSNWQWRKNELALLNVEYGGYMPYDTVHKTLIKADCLLLTSSFTPEWQTHSQGSLQTKITDYLKAGRLVISCGPSYSANHDFLKQYACGICIETNDETKAAFALNDILNNIEINQKYVRHGYQVLKEELSFEVVHERLKKFLAA